MGNLYVFSFKMLIFVFTLIYLAGCNFSSPYSAATSDSSQLQADVSDSPALPSLPDPVDESDASDLGPDPLEVPPTAGEEIETSKLVPSHDVTAVTSLPHLNAIDYWDTYHELRKYDAVSVKVAILDGDFNTSHPDIKDNVILSYNFNGPCGETINAVNSEACTNVSPKNDVKQDELNSINHGTIIAGVIAGRGKYGEGIIGVNPSAKLILLKRDSSNNNMRALRGAIDSGADVISMSWPLGRPPGDLDLPAFEDLLEEATSKGVVVVMAAGNTNADVNQQAIYPTRYAHIPGVIAVGAMGIQQGQLASYSNYGNQYVNIAAPGTVISSGGNYSNAGYSIATGTSFSGPLVAGAASRVIQYLKKQGRTYTAAEVEDILNRGSFKNSALSDKITEGNELHLPSLLNYLSTAY